MASVIKNRIAELNDQLRTSVKNLGASSNVPGQIVLTRGISTLNEYEIMAILTQVSQFDQFTESNDPFGEHDFGSIELPNVGKVFWKIDIYADDSCRYGAEDPADLSQSYRVLTIMLAHEY